MKYLNQKVFYPTLKKHDFFLGNIEYIYQCVSNPTFEKKKKPKPGLVRVRPGRPGPGSTHRVVRVWPGCCHSRSFVKPGPVQPPGPGSTRRAGPGLITVVQTIQFKITPRFVPLGELVQEAIECSFVNLCNILLCFYTKI